VKQLTTLALTILVISVFIFGCAEDGKDGPMGPSGIDGSDGADGAKGATGKEGPGICIVEGFSWDSDIGMCLTAYGCTLSARVWYPPVEADDTTTPPTEAAEGYCGA